MSTQNLPNEHASAESSAAVLEVSMLDEILAETKLAPNDDGYEIAKRGVEAFLSHFLTHPDAGDKVDKMAIDMMIAEIDRKLSSQLNAILHHEEFQSIERSWRSLEYLVKNTDFRANCRVDILSCTKDELRNDFEDAPEITKSGLYRHAYSAEYGTFGGKPYGVMVSSFDFSPGPQDIQLLRNCAAVAAMSHAPFLANASPKFFGVESHAELPALKDLQSIFEGPQYAKWHGFRETEDARYVGLCVPRMLMRLPYGPESNPVKAFHFEEDVVGKHERYLWGPTSFAFAARLADSFARYKWAANCIGPKGGGAVENMNLHQFEAMGAVETKIPTEIQLTDRREYELAEQGFIGLVWRKESDNAAFFSANSVQKAKIFPNTPEGKAAETNFRLGMMLPYMFMITRVAHYIKVLQREQIGTFKSREDMEKGLNKWLSQYSVDMESPAPDVRARRPFRKAQIIVHDVDGQPGWYSCQIRLQPHFKYAGADFTLSLVGRLDKA